MSEIGIRVKVEGGSEGARALGEVADASDGLDDAAKRADDSVQGLATSFIEDLLPAWTQASSMYGLLSGGLLDIATRLYDAASAADQLGDIEDSLGGASQTLATQMTMGLIPALDLAQARGRAMAAGLELTDQQFAAVAAAAQIYAQRTGIDGAQAMDQLTGAVIAGNERALRPFGIHLAEGSTRAEGTAQAIRQLSDAAGENAAKIQETTGGLDALGAGWNLAKEGAVAFYGGIVNFALDGLFKLGQSIGQTVRALASGDASSLTKAFFDATDSSHDFAARVPLVGQDLAFAAQAARDFAAGLLGIRRPAEDAAAALGDLSGVWGDDESAAISFDMTADANFSMMAGVPGAGEGRGGTRRRGGGGGGGRRGLTAQQISDRERERLAAEEAAFIRAQREEAAEGGMFGAEQERARSGYGAEPRAGFNAERGGANAARGGRGPAEAFARGADAATKYAGALESLGAVGALALGSLGTAIEANVEAWVSGEKTIGQALAGILGATLKSIATEATVKALFYTAEGFAALVTLNAPAAASAFTAAGIYGAAAVLAGAGSVAVTAASGGGGSTSRAQSGGSARSNAGATRDSGSATTMVQQFIISPGAGIGGPKQLAVELNRTQRQQARQRNRVAMPVR